MYIEIAESIGDDVVGMNIDTGFVICQAPDSQLRGKKRVAGKVVPQQDSGGGQSCAAGPKLCVQNNLKKHLAGLCWGSASR